MNTLIDWEGMSEYDGFNSVRDMFKLYWYECDNCGKKTRLMTVKYLREYDYMCIEKGKDFL